MLSRLPRPGREFMENYAIVLKIKNGDEEEEKREKGEEKGEEMIGVIGIPRLSPSGLSAEVGYALLPEYWGMGYASEALILFTSYYFKSSRKNTPHHSPPLPPPPPLSPLKFSFSFSL
jgi:RimJ/RimL family protein N-acetyltransferase